MASSRRSPSSVGRALAALAASADRTARSRWVVAYSGGLDSTVLLHAAVAAVGARSVVAVHVHHGLQAAADGWLAHCAQQAAALDVAFECARLPAAPARGASVEAWAREHRYRALALVAARTQATAILTAHHADDQVETMLMRIARGTGIDGLAGIAPVATLAGATVLRPLLDLPRAELAAYARAHALSWVEDPSNADLGRARNAIRHRVLPAIDATLPGFRAGLLDALPALRAARDAQQARARSELERARRADGLDRRELARLPAQRRRAVLREWLREQGLRMPSEARLLEIERQLVGAGGAYGHVSHEGVALTRYRDSIVALPASLLPDAPRASVALRWRGEARIALPEDGGHLLIEPARAHFEASGAVSDAVAPEPAGYNAPGVAAEWLRGQPLTVMAGGASSLRLRPRAGGHRRTLKNLYQERGVPAWLRPTLPLVFAGEELLYASGLGMDADPARGGAGERVVLHWQPTRTDDPRAAWCPPR